MDKTDVRVRSYSRRRHAMTLNCNQLISRKAFSLWTSSYSRMQIFDKVAHMCVDLAAQLCSCASTQSSRLITSCLTYVNVNQLSVKGSLKSTIMQLMLVYRQFILVTPVFLSSVTLCIVAKWYNIGL